MKNSKMLFMLGLLLVGVWQVFASHPVYAEELQTIVVTSLTYDDEQDVPQQTQTGQKLPLLTSARGVNGKEFRLYDVTDHFRRYRRERAEVADPQLTKLFIETLSADVLAAVPFNVATTQTVATEDGVATFQVPKEDEHGYRTYLLTEVSADDEETAAPILIRLPLYNQSQALDTIYLYTKRRVREVPPTIPPDLKKAIIAEKASYMYGDNIHYQVAFTVPSEVETAETFQIVDEHATSLQATKAATVSLDGTALDVSFYTTEATAKGTTFHFDPTKLIPHIGATITLDYELQLQDLEPQASEFPNTASLWINGTKELEVTKTVHTGGKYFRKVALETGQPLAGASFQITNAAGQVLTTSNHGYEWQAASEAGQSTVKISSNQSGEFSINGLAYGTYYLEEVEAPQGYVKNQESIAFEIAKGTFENTPHQFLEVMNKQAPATEPSTTKAGGTSYPPTASGTFGKSFPMAGEIASSSTLWLGLLLLLGTGLVWRKRSGRK